MDVKHLRVGTTLFLPVGVEGALFSVGDTHAAMGDGVGVRTAVEAHVSSSAGGAAGTISALQSRRRGDLARTEADRTM
jgi:hypothetical protein